MALSSDWRLPRLAIIACAPLVAICGVLFLSRALDPIDHNGAAMIGFAAVLAYLFAFQPALFLVEPFAIIVALVCTRRWYDRYGAPFAPVAACWTATLLHSAALVFFLRLGR